jgi:hypothetical protein
MLDSKEILSLHERFRSKVKTLFPTRATELNDMYNDLEDDDRLLSPASSIEHFHNAFPGGYMEHVLRVVDFAEREYHRWQEDGLLTNNFDLEELLFAAFHHDLGKLGLPGKGNGLFVPNTSDWHVKNQGKIYVTNPKLPFAVDADTSLYMLQHYGIKMTWQEQYAIRVHGGPYDKINEPYNFTFWAENKPKTNIGTILHYADLKATRFEFERWAKKTGKVTMLGELPKPQTKKPEPIKTTVKTGSDAVDAIFNEFFKK